MARITGKIKFFMPAQGYGFIERDDGQKDVFVHARQLKESKILWLQEGCKLTFEVGDDGKGPRAEKLQVAQ